MIRGGCYSERQQLCLVLSFDVRTPSAGGSAGCRNALRPTGLAERICPAMRSATRPLPRNSAAIFFPAAAPLLARQQDRRPPSFACAAA